MPAARPVATFLLEPTALTFALADPAGGPPTRVASEPLPAGAYMLGPGDDPGRPEALDLAALRAAVRACVSKAGAGRVRKARLLVEGPLVRPFTLPVPFRPDDAELRTAVQTEAERYLIFAGSEVAVGFAVLRQEPERLVTLFGAARRDVLEGLVTAFLAEKITLEAVEPASLAYARALSATYDRAWDAGEGAGVAALLGRRIDVSIWSESRPTFWRSVMVDGAAIRRGDEAAIAEASLELQRTLVELPARSWLLADMPAPLAEIFRQRPGAEIQTRGGEWPAGAFAGALTGDLRAFGMDLRPPVVAAERSFSDLQMAGVLAFGAIAAGLLGTMLVLDGKIRAARSELDAVETRAAQLQVAVLAARQGGGEAEGFEGTVRGSAIVGLGFDALRDCTPADTWITSAKLEAAGPLRLDGVSLGADSPFAMARALAAWPELREVGMPELKRDAIQGREVFRFTLTAKAVAK